MSAQVAQETIAEPRTFARSRDQTGYIGQDEGALLGDLDDAKMRHEGRERIIRDLGSRRADSRDERGRRGCRHPRGVGQGIAITPMRRLRWVHSMVPADFNGGYSCSCEYRHSMPDARRIGVLFWVRSRGESGVCLLAQVPFSITSSMISAG